jgi:putative Mn2+ efflux pump MntP
MEGSFLDIGTVQWGELLSVSMIAVALGMDAFSLCVGMGMAGIRLRNVVKVSTLIGAFHILMPLVGMVFGFLLTGFMGNIASYVGGIILSILGIQMLVSAYNERKEQTRKEPSFLYSTYLGLFLFALSVSLDALTVGISFAIFQVNTLVALIAFGLAGTIMSAIGLLLGRKLGNWVGSFGNMLGGCILLIFGIKFLL